MTDRILLGHGSGGRMMHELISRRFAPAFGIEGTADAAVLGLGGGRIAFSTDSYVVSPIFFPGGDIGDLAVNGTVNDLAVSGARPLYLTAGFIVEEGFPMADLDRVVASMARAARAAGVRIVAGDTKVVDKGKGDGLFICTSGVGVVPEGVELGAGLIEPGDSIVISGPIGAHGVAVMAERAGLSFDPPVVSDTAPLTALAEGLVSRVSGEGGDGGVRVMRDPTRGGLATTLKEFALACGLCLVVDEDAVRVPSGVRGACDLLGIDPLYVANEGVLVAVVKSDMAQYHVERMRGLPSGGEACVIGEVRAAPQGAVHLRTSIGGRRMLDMLPGGQLPRIC